MAETPDTNDQLILIAGYSATGKSSALRNIKNQEKWFYLNCEAGKRLPFRNKFQQFRIDDPYQVHEAFEHAIAHPEVEGIVIDSITFLMDMFESMYVLPSPNTMKAWSDYAQFFKTLMQNLVVRFARPVTVMAHVKDELDEKAMEMKTFIPIKGSLKNNGIEAYFSCAVASKRMTMKELNGFSSNLLNISEEEKELGFKYVFQTRLTAKTTGERIRSPMGLFDKSQTYMDNDAQLLLDHLHAFYG